MKRQDVALIADALGRGLVAGLGGTAALTVSSMVEMKLRGRSASTAATGAAYDALFVERRRII